jgi:hypothetical protein
MDRIHLFAPFTKIDKEKRMVRGVATAEVMDSQGEVLTYAGSKAAMQSWVGNIREMHQAVAVGKRVEIEFDDARRLVIVTAYVSRGAQDTWEKCLDGTLSMYSIGGARLRSTLRAASECPEQVFAGAASRPSQVRWTDTWRMHELSLVDAGANPKAVFELVKFRDGRLIATDILESGEAGTASGREQKIIDQMQEITRAAIAIKKQLDAAHENFLDWADDFDFRLSGLESPVPAGYRLMPTLGRR